MFGSDGLGPSTMLLAGLLLLTVILMRRALRRSQGVDHSPEERSSLEASSDPTTSLRDAPPEVLRWHVALHETARDMKAELDSKISVLRTFVDMAQHEREQLEQAIERARSTEARSTDELPR